MDRYSAEDLRRHYPELAALPLVDPDIIDNGETLESIADASQDFVISVTDHDDVRPSLMAEEYVARINAPILIVPGLEVTTNESHLVTVGVRDQIAGWRPLTETIEEARKLGSVVILPHPAFAHLRARTDVDAIERYNSRYGDFPVESSPVAIVANSDAHNATELRNKRRKT